MTPVILICATEWSSGHGTENLEEIDDLQTVILDISESEVAQSCLTLCHPMDCGLPTSSVHGDFPGKNTGVVANVNEYRLVLPILKVLGDLNFVV